MNIRRSLRIGLALLALTLPLAGCHGHHHAGFRPAIVAPAHVHPGHVRPGHVRPHKVPMGPVRPR